MTGLAGLQHAFKAYVLGESTDAPITVAGTGGASARERLGVYAEAIELRFREVLLSDFEGVAALLGDDGFAALGRSYAAAHPSRRRSIRWFAEHLPAYVRDVDPWRQEPVLAEMASFEWSKSLLVDAPDSEVIDLQDVAAVAPEAWGEIRPRLKPATRRLSLHFNVPAIWTALDAGEGMQDPVRAQDPVSWLLWRQDTMVRWRSIDEDERWALDACEEGLDFGELCDGLGARVGEDAAAMRAASCLKQWCVDGVLESL